MRRVIRVIRRVQKLQSRKGRQRDSPNERVLGVQKQVRKFATLTDYMKITIRHYPLLHRLLNLLEISQAVMRMD
ncbi:hypothetical protein FGO68_gene1789 [Halteria grandinella]|uniref:Uncharacterized protein n=1 Tax=Halteria grandinella TaxID=5974 RepID=A0A8J8NRC3_HALGN|nr:hypothetical protein FGO68_gene1789 [Halteria grandinella]